MTRRRSDDAAARVAALYDRYAGTMYRYALMLLADAEGAADAVHDVFVALLTAGIHPREAERYLRRAVRNRCYSRFRGRERQSATLEPSAMLEPLVPGDDPIVRVAIERALRELPPEQRETVHLKVFEGMTFQEIADLTGDSINTVASRYRYAIEKLRQQLGGR